MSSSDLKCKLQLSFREEFECYEMFFPWTQRSFSNVNTPTKACFLVYHTRYLSWRCWVFYMMSCWKLMLGVKVSLNTCSMKATVEIYAVFWIKLLQRLKKKKKKYGLWTFWSELDLSLFFFFFKKKVLWGKRMELGRQGFWLVKLKCKHPLCCSGTYK